MKSLDDWTRPTRRGLLKGGAVAMAGVTGAMPNFWTTDRLGRDGSIGNVHPADVARDPRVKALLAAALDAARKAGATYADGRVTLTRTRSFFLMPPADSVMLGLSVRALVNGYWGWAATPMLRTDEATRVGKAAVMLAKSLATQGRSRVVDWTPLPAVTGDWVTPVEIDPFETALEELIDWGIGLRDYISRLGASRGDDTRVEVFSSRGIAFDFMKQERAFASTEGSYLTQTIYRTTAEVPFVYKGVSARIANLGAVNAGWEFVRENAIRDAVEQTMGEIDRDIGLPVKPVDIGRYDIVFHHNAMASFLTETLAEATQLDRALGYEANASGTSYLGPDPRKYLGTSVAAPMVTLTGNRSARRGLATVGWDDEGVAPKDFALVQDGILVDYQTTREQAPWLADWYKQRGEPTASRGCSQSPTAMELAMQHTPNLALTPGQGEQDFDALVAGLDKGLAISACVLTTDQQCLNGLAMCANVVEVRNGKRVSRAPSSVGILFRSPEFWKNISALGGPSSVRSLGIGNCVKGNPERATDYSVAVVPAMVKQLSVIDPMRKAS